MQALKGDPFKARREHDRAF